MTTFTILFFTLRMECYMFLQILAFIKSFITRNTYKPVPARVDG